MSRSTHLRSDRGATLVEYSLLVALIAVVSIAALSALSDNSAAAFEDASGAVSDDDSSSAGPGPSNPGPSNPGPSNPGPSNPGPSNPGPDDDAEVGGEEVDNDNSEDVDDQPTPPPTVSSSFPRSSATRHGNGSHNWTAQADLQLSGTDGQPLVGSVAVEVTVIERGEDHKGSPVENVYIETVYVSNGIGSISHKVRDDKANSQHDAISSITYQVERVTSISGGTDVEWDGTSPTITVLAP